MPSQACSKPSCREVPNQPCDGFVSWGCCRAFAGGNRCEDDLCCGTYVAYWHVCDIARSRMDFRFWEKSGRAADITATTDFDPKPRWGKDFCGARTLFAPLCEGHRACLAWGDNQGRRQPPCAEA
jgi:hypothetical protein